MATVIGPFQTGPSLTDAHIIAGTLNAAGAFNPAATMNMVPVEIGGFGTIRALKLSGAAAKLGLIKSLYTHGYVYRTSGVDVYAGFFVFSNLGTPHEGLEEQDETLDCEPAKIVGESQFVRTAA